VTVPILHLYVDISQHQNCTIYKHYVSGFVVCTHANCVYFIP